MRIICFLVFIICCTTLFSQNNISISIDPTVNSLITKNVYLNKAAKVKGWRVLIASHTERRKMEADKRMMETNYPNLPIVWEQTDPYFKLKVGGCQTKLEALRLSYLLNSVFPSAIPTIDKSIKLSDFLYSL